MKQFEFNDKKYSLPENWKEVSFKQLKEIMRAERVENNDALIAARIVSILSGLDYETMVNCESTLTLKLVGQLRFITERDVEGSIQHFKIGKDTFYVNTLADSVYKEFATFEVVDQKYPEDPEKAMSLKLAILCRKDGETFLEIENELEKRSEMFDELDAETVFKINGFFLLRRKLSQLSFQASSRLLKERQGLEQLLVKQLMRSSAGSPWLCKWLLRLHSWSLSMLSRRKMF